MSSDRVAGAIGRLFGECDHPELTIVAIRDDLSAVYNCEACGDEVKPWEMDQEYRLKRSWS